MSDLFVAPVPAQKKISLSFFLKVVPFVLLTVIALLVGFYYYRTKFNKPKTYKDLRVVNVAKLKKANYQFVEIKDLIGKVSGDSKPLGDGTLGKRVGNRPGKDEDNKDNSRSVFISHSV